MEETKTAQPHKGAEPQKEHRWLHRLVGDWTFKIKMETEPGEDAQEFDGVETVRSLGDIWVIAEGKGEVPDGGTAKSMMTLGYDPEKGEFVGNFVASMMTHLWVYQEGKLDDTARTLSLYAEGPDMSTPGRMALYRDVIEFKNDDQRTLTSFVQTQDGQWQLMMTAYYQREK